ncbi:MAG TPA: VOC family protein [Opitutaceae bacterium]|nr:VOC family protein [Opitutaceae bacterium]
MEPRISIITLGVADLDRAVRFYRDGLGFPTSYKAGDGIAFFRTTGARLALYPRKPLAEDIGPDIDPGRPGFGGITLAHNVRTKDEVAQVLALAEKAGATIVKPAQDVFWGGHSGYFRDLDGNHWEVAWGPMFTFDESGALGV